MNRQLSLMMIMALSLAACGKTAPGKDPKADVLTGTGSTVVYYTTQCTEPNADGVRCDKKTCKADAGSDCKVFSDRCTQSGHSYEGNDSAGTCTRGDQVG
jgi:predicted small lipoprotein YifL